MAKTAEHQRPGPKPAGLWVVEARALRQAIGTPVHGEKEGALQKAMKAVGMPTRTPTQSARRRLSGLTFTEEFSRKHRLDQAALQNHPLASIELIARWNAHDAQGALKAAKELIKGNYSVTTLANAERDARKASKIPAFGRELDRAARDKILPWLTTALAGFTTWIPQKRPRSCPGKSSARGSAAQGSRGLSFCLREGDRCRDDFRTLRDHRLFELRQAEFIQRLMGLSLYHNQVWAILPLEQKSLQSENWLKDRLSLNQRPQRTGLISRYVEARLSVGRCQGSGQRGCFVFVHAIRFIDWGGKGGWRRSWL